MSLMLWLHPAVFLVIVAVPVGFVLGVRWQKARSSHVQAAYVQTIISLLAVIRRLKAASQEHPSASPGSSPACQVRDPGG